MLGFYTFQGTKKTEETVIKYGLKQLLWTKNG